MLDTTTKRRIENMDQQDRQDQNLLHSKLTRSIIGCAFEVINELGNGFEDIGYDYIAPEASLVEAKRQVQARWRRMHPLKTFQARSELFFDSQGEVDVGAVRDVLRRRDRRQVHISE